MNPTLLPSERRSTGVAARPSEAPADVLAAPPTSPNRTVAGLTAAAVLAAVDVGVFLIVVSAALGTRWEVLAGAVALIALNSVAGLYRSRLTLVLLDDAPALVGRALLAVGLSTTLIAFTSEPLGSGHLILCGVVTATILLVSRWLVHLGIRFARVRGLVSHRTMIVGTGEVGRTVYDALESRHEFGLTPVAFYDVIPPAQQFDLPTIISGSIADAVVDVDARVVIVAYSIIPEQDMVHLLRACDRLNAEIFVVPRLFELHSLQSREVDSVWSVPLIRLRRSAHRSPTWRIKRLIDVFVSGLALLVMAPLLAAVAAAVRFDGGPGVIFRQERVGMDGIPFTILKFRSMRPESDDESATQWNIGTDHRVSRLGRFLRTTSIDELPQFWNVFRGDMSLVGPRPERAHFVEEFTKQFNRYPWRHRAPSGLTGLAQINGLRGDTSIEDRVRYDNAYVENWSLWLDLKIVLRSFIAVVIHRGA